ncbi:hypothetical protein Tco_1327517 [Tanacetum coccineum]
MSFVTMADEITLESLTEEQFECFIEYYHENYPEDFKSDLENLKEVYKVMNGGVEYPHTHSTSPSETYAPYKPLPRIDPFEQPPCLGSTFVSEALRKSDQMHQTFDKRSLAMTHKFDDMIELPKSQSKKTFKEDLKCEIVMVKMPKCMSWLDAYDEPIGDLDMMEDKVDNPSPQITNVDEPKPQSLSNFPSLDVNLGDKRGIDPLINTYSPGSFRMEEITNGNLRTRIFKEKKNIFFINPGDGVRFNDGVSRLYLRRRSLEVLRKFHWTILGGRFNQLSHVSSPLLSKQEEY